MRRVLITPILPLAVAAILVACDTTTEPSVNSEFRSILAWDDPPAHALSATTTDHVADTSGLGPGSELPTLTPPGIEAPDTVDAGVPFTVTATTLLPSVCWEAGDVVVTVDRALATIEIYDAAPDPKQPCILLVGRRTTDVELRFDAPGEATIEVVGRRVQGEAYYDQFEIVERIERTVVVR